MRKEHLGCLVPLGLYLVAVAAFSSAGHGAVRIPWDYYQLLDREAITEAPLRSLLLLHAQPPGLNALLAVLLRLAGATGVGLDGLVTGLFLLVGGISTVMLHALLADLSRSRVLAGGLTGLMLADPGYHLYQHLFFYPFLLHALMIGGLFLFNRLLATGRPRFLYGSVAVLAAVTNTRSLFPPVWAGACLLLLLVLNRRRQPDPPRRPGHGWIAASVLVLLLAAWPMKNRVLFDTFTFSTWSGINLQAGTPVRSEALDQFFADGTVPDQTRRNLQAFADRFGDDRIGVLSSPTKMGGAVNWNHYVFVDTARPLARAAARWKIAHPVRTMMSFLRNYIWWTQPSYVSPYTGRIGGPETGAYAAYARLHRAVFFADLRALLPMPRDHVWDCPITLFGAVVLPGLAGLSLAALRRAWRTRPEGLARELRLLLLAGFTSLWALALPCLTDGIEGNRMRFCVTPCLLVLWAVVTARHPARTSAARPARAEERTEPATA